jgi:hypothetical protein
LTSHWAEPVIESGSATPQMAMAAHKIKETSITVFIQRPPVVLPDIVQAIILPLLELQEIQALKV